MKCSLEWVWLQEENIISSWEKLQTVEFIVNYLLLILHCLTLFYDRHSLEKMAFTRAVHATTCHVDSSTRQLQPTNMDEFALCSENSKWYQCTIA